MLRFTKQGFTLIELMVVIVIIGVLASLAIPRFTDASVKAKVAEAPRVIASFESAYLAGVAEGNVSTNNLVFATSALSSKWFGYSTSGTGLGNGTPTNGDGLVATANVKLGAKFSSENLNTSYDASTENFTHSAGTNLTKYVPNFLP